MDGSTADFHSGHWIQYPDSTLERLEIRVLVREDAKSALVDAKTNAGMDVLFRGLEPSIAGGLGNGIREYGRSGREKVGTQTCLKI